MMMLSLSILFSQQFQLHPSKTIEAIEKFQQDTGIPVSGKLDQDTVSKLGLSSPAPDATPTQPTAVSQEIQATTADGKMVMLSPDGTWKYIEVPKPSPQRNGGFKKPATSTKLVKTRVNAVQLWIDENKWKQESSEDPQKIQFTHQSGEAWALINAERTGITENAQKKKEFLKTMVITNAQSVMSDVTITAEEFRVVNGVKILYLTVEGKVQQVLPMRLWGYYYTGKIGTVQVATFTSENLFQEFGQDFMNFLNGVEIIE